MRHTTAVVRIPPVVRQAGVAYVIPITEPARCPPPARILPLPLRRQPIHAAGRNPTCRPLALRKVGTVIRGFEPIHRLYGTIGVNAVVSPTIHGCAISVEPTRIRAH